MTLPIRPFLVACGGTLVAILVSFALHRLPVAQAIAAFVIAAAAAGGYRRSFATGTAVVLAELAAGSLGRSFVLPWGGVSVRMLLFAVAVAATAAYVIRNKNSLRALITTPVRIAFGLVASTVGWGIVRGIAVQPLGDVVADANAYVYLLLAPTFLIALRDERDRRMLLSVLLGAATAVAVQTLAIFFLATRGFIPTTAHPLYKWIRDAGFGELTPGASGFARVFFQSHLWSAATVLLAPGLYVLARAAKKERRVVEISAVLSSAVLFISLSRSFWLSTAGAAAVGLVLVVLRRNLRPGAATFIVSLAVFTALGVAVPYALSRSVGSAVSGRVTAVAGEPAADSRMNLLRVMWPAVLEHPVLGSGFGKALTYETRDPRLLAYFPDGQYTTSAFEWGWLDFWLKMGVLGPIAFATLVVVVLMTCWRALSGAEPWVALGLLLAVLMVSAAHVLSPWLNHPLGIGLMLFALGIVLPEIKRTPKDESRGVLTQA
ncbi:O-antigen ligase domain-containing protein [Patescibacteria group bacterium]|nr:MAG: O-antigen ligase domain-containing protein [Patescibacteria group bacterium]